MLGAGAFSAGCGGAQLQELDARLSGEIQQLKKSNQENRRLLEQAGQLAQSADAAAKRLDAAMSKADSGKRLNDLEKRVEEVARTSGGGLTIEGAQVLGREIRDAKAEMEQQREDLRGMRSAVAQLQQGGGGSADMERMAVDLANAQRASADLGAKLRSALQYHRAALAKQQESLTRLEASLQQAADALKGASGDSAAQVAAAIESQRAAAAAQRDSLNEAIQEFDDTIESLKALFAK